MVMDDISDSGTRPYRGRGSHNRSRQFKENDFYRDGKYRDSRGGGGRDFNKRFDDGRDYNRRYDENRDGSRRYTIQREHLKRYDQSRDYNKLDNGKQKEDDQTSNNIVPKMIMTKANAEKTILQLAKKQERNGHQSPAGSPARVAIQNHQEVRAQSPGGEPGPAVVKKIIAKPDRGQPSKAQEKTAEEKQGALLSSIRSNLALAPGMLHSIKLVDNDCWTLCDSTGHLGNPESKKRYNQVPLPMLIDQPDFTTVGVLGGQGVGKSSLLTHLAGNNFKDSFRKFVFKPQAKDIRERGQHQTTGIHMAVTPERFILLDTQPLMSASILDEVIRHDKKFAGEATSAENGLEIQSLQLMAFMLSVCNIIFVVVDWFIDWNIIKMLQTAEILKPSSNIGHQDKTDVDEYFPKIVFVLNKAGRADFNTVTFRKMQSMLAESMETSRLRYKGLMNARDAGLIAGKSTGSQSDSVNLFLLPTDDSNEQDTTGGDGLDSLLLSNYKGHYSFTECMRRLRKSLFGAPQESLIPRTVLSEKNWFSYACRNWESIKKSMAVSEFNRLLP